MLVDVGHHLLELRRLLVIDREQPVPARRAAHRALVRPACRHPHRDARPLKWARLELAAPVAHQLVEWRYEDPALRPHAGVPGSSSNTMPPISTSSPGSKPADSSARITPIERRRSST